MTLLRIAALLSLLLFGAAASAESGRYAIDSGASDIHWRVYSAGLLAGLGHHHVISAGRISGSVQLADAPRASRLELVIPVSALEVDKAALRRRYGGDFSEQPSARAIAATRANMLGTSQLNAASYPQIRLRGSAVVGDEQTQNLLLAATLEVAGRSVKMRLPARLMVDGRTLRARGNFTLSHQQLGLTPFRAAAGALRVGQRIDFSYDIRAEKLGSE